MSILDDPERCAAADPQQMRALLDHFPAQVEEAAGIASRIDLHIDSKISNIVISGLGGSAIGGDIVRSAVGQVLSIPLVVNRDYRLPRFVDDSTLVFACSYSGDTEETLSAYEQAKQAGAAVVCITSGGQLAVRASAGGNPVIKIPGGLPPRAAVGYSAVVLLGSLRALRLVPGIEETLREVTRLVASLVSRYTATIPEASNRAKTLARSLQGKIVAVYAASGTLEAAAVRWRGQMEENAKNLAWHHLLPEMNHNELVGWKCPHDVIRNVGVVFLRDREDHPQVQRRFDFTREFVESRAGAVQEVWSEGNSPLARIFSVISLGDYVSLYLAYLNAENPTPVEAIESLKKNLAQ